MIEDLNLDRFDETLKLIYKSIKISKGDLVLSKEDYIKSVKHKIIIALEKNNPLHLLIPAVTDLLVDSHGYDREQARKTAEISVKTTLEKYKKEIKNQELPADIMEYWEKNHITLTVPNPFEARNSAAIASSAPVVSGLEAIVKPHKWQDDIFAFFRNESKSNNKNYIEHYITNPGDITLLPWNEAKQIIDKFNPEVAKLHLLLAAYCMNVDSPWKNQFIIKASEIVELFGWDRKDKSQGQKLKDAASLAFLLDSILVRAEWEEGRKKNGKISVSIDVSRLWNISFRYKGDKNLFGEVEEPEEIYITVQPGLWTEGFLNKAGSLAKKALFQFGYIAQDVFKLNAYQDEFVLRGLMYLTLASRYHTSGYYKVHTLLSECVLNPDIQIAKAREDKVGRHKLKGRWDNFLNTLSKMGWQIVYDAESYPEELRPEFKGNNPRNYFEKLLEARLTVLPPDEIPAPQVQLTATNPKTTETQLKATKPKTTPKTPRHELLTAAEVKAARKAKGWSQEKLAGFISESRKKISRIETGEYAVDKKLDAKLRKTLGL